MTQKEYKENISKLENKINKKVTNICTFGFFVVSLQRF